MIKRVPITMAYQINIYCDKCGKPMEKADYILTTSPPSYVYKCECGYREMNKISFPTQMVTIDTSKEEVWEAEE